MEFVMLQIAIAIAGCLAATYFDLFRNRNVPSLLSYSFVAIGFLFTILSGSVTFIEVHLAVAAIIFLLGYLFYRAGQIGGADVLLFTALALLLPDPMPSLLKPAELPISYPPVVSVFILSGALAILGIGLKYAALILLDVRRGERITLGGAQLLLPAAITFAYLAVIYVVNSVFQLSAVAFAALITLTLLSLFLSVFKEHIANRYMIKFVGVDEIDEEDVMALDRIDAAVVKKFGLKRVLTNNEIEKLRKMGKMTKFPVYKNMPVFIPYVLLALVLVLVFGNPLAYFFAT